MTAEDQAMQKQAMAGLNACRSAHNTIEWCAKRRCPYIHLYQDQKCIGRLHKDALAIMRKMKGAESG